MGKYYWGGGGVFYDVKRGKRSDGWMGGGFGAPIVGLSGGGNPEGGLGDWV